MYGARPTPRNRRAQSLGDESGSSWMMLGLLCLLALAAVAIVGLTTGMVAVSMKKKDDCHVERSDDASLDDRCGPCLQAKEQQKLDSFYDFFNLEYIQQMGLYFSWGNANMNYTDRLVWTGSPRTPDSWQEMWDRVQHEAKKINMKFLDPYDVELFKYGYLRDRYFSWHQNQTAVCEYRFEDMMLIGDAMASYGVFDPAPVVNPTSWLMIISVPPFNPHFFELIVREINTLALAVRARIDVDWWQLVADRVVANGGVIPSSLAAQHMALIAADIGSFDPLAVVQPVKLNIEQRGYVMTLAEEAALDLALQNAYDAQVDFFDYSMAILPSITIVIPIGTYYQTYGWTACFGGLNGLWYYNMTVADAQDWFTWLKARAEELKATLLAERDLLWPDPQDVSIPWGDTWIHYLFPEGFPNELNITGWGFDPAQCEDINPAAGWPLFGDTLAQVRMRFENEKWMLYEAESGPEAAVVVTFAFGECQPLTGNGGTSLQASPRNTDYDYAPSVSIIGPTYTLNYTYSVFLHENKHVQQSTMIAGTACITCWSRFAYPNIFTLSAFSLPLTTTPSYAFLSYTEGGAVDAEQQAGELGLLNRWEHFQSLMLEQLFRDRTTAMQLGVRTGFWTSAEAVQWSLDTHWLPNTNAAAIDAANLREPPANLGWYGVGRWKIVQWRDRAIARCGDAFDTRTFNTLSHAIVMGPTQMWDRLFDDYVSANCVSRTTRFGDARRTVVAEALQ